MNRGTLRPRFTGMCAHVVARTGTMARRLLVTHREYSRKLAMGYVLCVTARLTNDPAPRRV